MKRLNITLGTILLVLGCFAFSPAAKADQPVVGLWQVEYTGACEPPVLPPDFFTYQQFHSDGLEFESANLFPGAHCMGTWKQMGHMVQIYHVGWTPVVSLVSQPVYASCLRKHLPSATTAIVTTGQLMRRFTTRLWAETLSRIAPLQPMRGAFP